MYIVCKFGSLNVYVVCEFKCMFECILSVSLSVYIVCKFECILSVCFSVYCL